MERRQNARATTRSAPATTEGHERPRQPGKRGTRAARAARELGGHERPGQPGSWGAARVQRSSRAQPRRDGAGHTQRPGQPERGRDRGSARCRWVEAEAAVSAAKTSEQGTPEIKHGHVTLQ